MLVDVQQKETKALPYDQWGPWSPSGRKALSFSGNKVHVLEWPLLKIEKSLELEHGLWLGEEKLIEVKNETLRVVSLETLEEKEFSTSGLAWQFIHPFSFQEVIGLCQRTALGRQELISWTPGHLFPLAHRLPDLEGKEIASWAWAPDGESWGGLVLGDHPCLHVWSFPAGWTQHEIDVQGQPLAIAHLGDAVAWLERNSVSIWFLGSQALFHHTLTGADGARFLSWNGIQRTLAVTGSEGLDILWVPPDGA